MSYTTNPNPGRRSKVGRDQLSAGFRSGTGRTRLRGRREPRAVERPGRAGRPAGRRGRPRVRRADRRARGAGVLAGHRRRRRRHHADSGTGQGVRDPELRRERQDRAGRRDAPDHRALRAAAGDRGPPQPVRRDRRHALFGAVGAVAAITRPAGSPLDVLTSMVGAVAGIVALQWLLAPLTTPAAAPPVVDDAVPASGAPTPTSAWSTGSARPWARATARAPRWTGAASSPHRWRRPRRGGRRRRRRAVAPATLRRGRGPRRPGASPAGVRGRAPPGGRPVPRDRGPDHAVHGEPGVLPGRHRDQRSADPARRLPAVADRHVRLAPQLHAAGPVRARRPHRARRHPHLRLQRGGRRGRHRPVARRAPRRLPAGERHPVGQRPARLPGRQRHDHQGADALGSRGRGTRCSRSG